MVDERQKAITLDDIARQAGVSVSTVSRALNGGAAVRSATRRRILELAQDGDYEAPERRSRSAKAAITKTITIVLAPSHDRAVPVIDPFSLGLVGGVSAALRERKIDLSISHLVPADLRSLNKLFEDRSQKGLIFLGQSQLHDALNKVAGNGHRFVVWGAELAEQSYCCVGSDNFRGGYRAAAHLLRLGRRRIAFVGHLETLELQQRYDGYRSALNEADIEIDPALYRSCWLVPDSAYEAANEMLEQDLRFDAVVCASDLVALGFIRALMRRGLSIPDDVAIVGYDDIDIAAQAHPALTTIRQDTAKAGRLLISKVLHMSEGQHTSGERLATELIVRESCGA